MCFDDPFAIFFVDFVKCFFCFGDDVDGGASEEGGKYKAEGEDESDAGPEGALFVYLGEVDGFGISETA